MPQGPAARPGAGVASAPPAQARVDDALASLVHELRTPLTAVRGFIDTVLDRGGELDQAQREQLLQIARRNAEILTQRVQEILEVHRLDTSGIKLPAAAQDVAGLLDAVVTDCAGVTTGHEVALEAPEGVLVDANRDAVHHILSNILSNAAIHSPKGSRIRVDVGTGATEVSVSVSDTGSGIPPDVLPYVFQRGYRAGHHQRGNGIGLSVAARYVAFSGGRIAITSTGDTGTTVTFTLPRTPASVSQLIRVDDEQPARITGAPAAGATAEPGPPPSGVR